MAQITTECAPRRGLLLQEMAPNVFVAWSINSKKSNCSYLTRTMQIDKEK